MFLAGVWAVDAVSNSHTVPNWLVCPNPPYSQAELYSPGTAEVYYSPFYSCSPGLSMSNTNVRQYCWDPAGVGVWNWESYTAPQRLINAACWSQLPYWLIGLKSGVMRVCFWEGERWGRVPERGFARRGWRGALCSVAVVSSTADQLKHTQGREHTSASILGSERWLKNTAWTARQACCVTLLKIWCEAETWIIPVSPCMNFSGVLNGHAVDLCFLHVLHDIWLIPRSHAFKIPCLMLLSLCLSFFFFMMTRWILNSAYLAAF